MNPQLKTRPDDTRARIMETAEALFRRLGFAKTAVADIAAELGMSPANVYRFFPSKNAIVEAICQRCLNELDTKAWAVARSPGSGGVAAGAAVRRDLQLPQGQPDHREARARHGAGRHGEQLGGDRGAYRDDPRGDRKDPARRHREAASSTRSIARETSVLIKRAMVHFCHPLLVAECLQEGEGEAEAREHGPLPAARHHTPRVIDHVPLPMRLTAPED